VRRHATRVAAAAAAVLLPLATLAGCGDLGSTSGAQGFITQAGNVVQVAPADRKAPIALSGTTLDGKPLDLASYRGKVLVVNIWGSWCDPCIAEAPLLAQAASRLPVPFVGIDIRDQSADNAASYNRSYGISYPSIYDPGSTTLLAFRDYPVQSPPTTFVLDQQGRVAAAILGQVPSVQTLEDVVDQVRSGS